jgi:hypothetical protein
MPVARARQKGQQPNRPHIDPRAINDAMASMPGVAFSTHGFRAALATCGPEDIGWLAAGAKLILDHLEGDDPGGVTAEHCNTNPELMRRRACVSWQEQRRRRAAAAPASAAYRQSGAGLTMDQMPLFVSRT